MAALPRMIPRLDRVPLTDDLYAAFAAALRLHGFEGDIEDNYATRTVLATDNSIYQVLPQLTVFPRTTLDVTRVARLLGDPRFSAIKAYPRGGGTGTNGQSLGDGMVVDISRHMNNILEINVEERWARVQAGVVKDQLEAAVRAHGLFFAPELSTSNRATIGGMVSTDASGQGSCRYGKTRDHVLELTTVLLDGETWHSRVLSEAEFAEISGRDDLAGAVHRCIDGIHRSDAERIKAHFPPLNRCLTGYDLAHIRDDAGRFNLNNILCGSEGTLGFLVEAKVNLLPIPKHAALIVVSYSSFDAALRDSPRLLALDAASIEAIDPMVIRLARDDNAWPTIARYFPPETEKFDGVNLVEFTSDDPEALRAALQRAIATFEGEGGGNARGVLSHAIVEGHAAVEDVWSMRKRSVGLLGRMKGDKRPIPFVEDTAVPPEHLADYIAEFRQLLDSHGLVYGMFGHADAGVLHVRPAIDMKDPAQEPMIRAVTDGVAALTQKYGGVLWGEHGKGMRSEYSPRFFGPLYPRLQEIKAAFDPRQQLNPGKIATVAGAALLRIDEVPTRGQHDRVIPITVRREFEDSLHCNGNGACFNFDQDDAMCPSWKATRDRRYSPKGRAGLLREWLRLVTVSGQAAVLDAPASPEPFSSLKTLPRRWRNQRGKGRGEYDFSHEVKDAMDTCLACKSCAGQCPIKVDVPAFRARFLELYYSRYLRPAKDWLLCALEPMLPWMAKAPRLSNGVLNLGLVKGALRRLNLLAIPSLSTIRVEKELRVAGYAMASAVAVKAARQRGEKPVVIVQDAFTTHFEAELVVDTFRLLRRLGFQPLLAPYQPNGKPLHVHGFLGRFGRVARRNSARLRDLATSGVDLVGIDPAMTLVYRSEYQEVPEVKDGPKVWLLQEWLAREFEAAPPRVSAASVSASGNAGVADTQETTYLLLPHCTEKTNVPNAMAQWRKVFDALGLTMKVLPSGCCGMSGTFGHEARNRATSETIYRQSWAGSVAEHGASGRLMATGYSCRSQVKLIEGTALPHPVSVLARNLSR
ncbi:MULTISPECIES: FAD-binding and (Fe-S)-binding domain-containing protein [unclassified Achromobacter]|uniref:D-2-hydroxyglutarate dehydrogenase YdiJ n=1 Tax=unclassified Achromobacter TaxID=2626865 RepID=UPI0018E916D5|nr:MULTISPECIES: FAD-binding and (Fe-S)-binding domain-containing protein [unclassified Achromobacter]